MIDLPVGKALIAVLSGIQCDDECLDEDFQCPLDCCNGCEMGGNAIGGGEDGDVCSCLCCSASWRRDQTHVIYKLVDYPFIN